SPKPREPPSRRSGSSARASFPWMASRAPQRRTIAPTGSTSRSNRVGSQGRRGDDGEGAGRSSKPRLRDAEHPQGGGGGGRIAEPHAGEGADRPESESRRELRRRDVFVGQIPIDRAVRRTSGGEAFGDRAAGPGRSRRDRAEIERQDRKSVE